MARVSLSSTETHESKKVTGVTFTIKRVTEPLRLQLRDTIAAPTQKVQDLVEEINKLEEGKKPEDRPQIAKLYNQIEQITADELNPAWVKWGLVDISEFDVDGVDITPENVRQSAPAGFYHEILITLKERTNLGGDEVKN